MPRMRSYLAAAFLLLPVVCPAAEAAKAPSPADAKTLTREALLAFDEAVQAEDFTSFHGFISDIWRAQITPAKLKTIFQTFIDQQLDLSFVSSLDPVFTRPAAIDEDGILVLEGQYAATPNKAEFRLKFVQEKPGWKLIGIKVDVKPAGPAEVKMPTENECKALVRHTLLTFDGALEEKSFAAFYADIAPMWQKQTTPEKLQALFQSFIDADVRIGSIAKLEPAFDPAPALNEDSLLVLKGVYASKPAPVRFDLAYLYQSPDWKLVKINVKIPRGDDEPETVED